MRFRIHAPLTSPILNRRTGRACTLISRQCPATKRESNTSVRTYSPRPRADACKIREFLFQTVPMRVVLRRKTCASLS